MIETLKTLTQFTRVAIQTMPDPYSGNKQR